jgi:hypothetical protein
VRAAAKLLDLNQPPAAAAASAPPRADERSVHYERQRE